MQESLLPDSSVYNYDLGLTSVWRCPCSLWISLMYLLLISYWKIIDLYNGSCTHYLFGSFSSRWRWEIKRFSLYELPYGKFYCTRSALWLKRMRRTHRLCKFNSCWDLHIYELENQSGVFKTMVWARWTCTLFIHSN